MKKIVSLCSVLILSACSTMTGTQADCFSKNEKFADAASCMRSQMDSLKWGSNAPLSALRDYQLYLNSVETKVKKNQMSDEDAKMQMQEYLIRLRNSYN
jgi:hypothetical protein